MLESNLLHVSNTRKSDNKKIEKVNVVSGLLFWKAKVVLVLVLLSLLFSFSHIPTSCTYLKGEQVLRSTGFSSTIQN
jgi:hypothetical protein